MKATRNLTCCVKALVGATSLALVLPLTALEKPAEKPDGKSDTEQAPKEKAGEADAESAAEQFDQDFAVMSLELAKFFKSLFKAFGGLQRKI